MKLEALKTEPRLLLEASLKPVQGTRFQPTGFPDLGAAAYTLADGRQMLLVESAQSVANHLEQSCLNEAKDDWLDELKGLPYILVKDDGGRIITNSILEAHRINSEYIISAKLGEDSFKKVLAGELKHSKRKPIDRCALIQTLFRRDPNALLHGAFLEEIDGRYRVMRAVSGFIEASDAKPAQSGGVKVNLIEPSLKGGKGNVPYPRTEFVAAEIKAFFNVDLALLRGYGKVLGNDGAADLLLALAVLKIQRFLSSGLRLRTACIFTVIERSLKVTNPEGFDLPAESELLPECKRLIQQCASNGLFASPAVTPVTWSREVRQIVIAIPSGSPDPKIPEDLEQQATFKKATSNKPASIEISPEHGYDPAELAEVLFPEHEEARKVALAELSATRIEVQDEDIKPKVPKSLKEKVRWSKPKGNQAGEIWIASDVGMEAQELAEALFPNDDSGQNLVLKAMS